MMFTTEVKEALIVLGVVLGVVWLTTPKGAKGGIPKPDVAPNTEIKDKENAMVALDAYMSAVENRENSKNLNLLNQELAKTYGLRVYKNGQHFVARNMEGKDILVAK